MVKNIKLETLLENEKLWSDENIISDKKLKQWTIVYILWNLYIINDVKDWYFTAWEYYDTIDVFEYAYKEYKVVWNLNNNIKLI